jgi:hypothetical protein
MNPTPIPHPERFMTSPPTLPSTLNLSQFVDEVIDSNQSIEASLNRTYFKNKFNAIEPLLRKTSFVFLKVISTIMPSLHHNIADLIVSILQMTSTNPLYRTPQFHTNITKLVQMLTSINFDYTILNLTEYLNFNTLDFDVFTTYATLNQTHNLSNLTL